MQLHVQIHERRDILNLLAAQWSRLTSRSKHMTFTATFPNSAGQYAGTHYFDTKKSRAGFIDRALRRGVDIGLVQLGCV